MAAEDIRIAFNPDTGLLCALHPDDGTYGPGVVAFRWMADPSAVPPEMMRRAAGLLVGPSLGEVIAAMEYAGQPGSGRGEAGPGRPG